MEKDLKERSVLGDAIIVALVLFTLATMSFGASNTPTKTVVTEIPEGELADTIAGSVWRRFGFQRVNGPAVYFSELLTAVSGEIRTIQIHQGNLPGNWRSTTGTESTRQLGSKKLWLLIRFKDGSSATAGFDGVQPKQFDRLYSSAKPIRRLMTRAVANGIAGESVVTEWVGRSFSRYPQVTDLDSIRKQFGKRRVRVDGSIAVQIEGRSGARAITTNVEIESFVARR